MMEGLLIGGAATLVAGGAFLTYLRWIPQYLATQARRRWMSRIEADDADLAFHCLSLWLTDKLKDRASGEWVVETNHANPNEPPSNMPMVQQGPAGRRESLVQFRVTPGPGIHIVWHNRKMVLVHRNRRQVEKLQDRRGYVEQLSLQTFGRSSKVTLMGILDESLTMWHAQQHGKLRVWQNIYGNWTISKVREPRPLESVHLPDGVAGSLVRDIERFLSRRQWYAERGIPYRRGYLLCGSPGNGKTSLVSAIAGHFHRDIYNLSLAGADMNDQNLMALLSGVPDSAIVLIEDADCAKASAERQESQRSDVLTEAIVQRISGNPSSLTLSGLLNAIDGVASSEGRILFLTTNYPEKLDSALLRPGRVDYRLELTNAVPEQAASLFYHFYRDDPFREYADAFGEAVAGKSMAEIQGILLEHPDDPLAAVEHVEQKVRAA